MTDLKPLQSSCLSLQMLASQVWDTFLICTWVMWSFKDVGRDGEQHLMSVVLNANNHQSDTSEELSPRRQAGSLSPLLSCVCVCTCECRCLWSPVERILSHGARVIGGCKLPSISVRNRTSVFCKSSMRSQLLSHLSRSYSPTPQVRPLLDFYFAKVKVKVNSNFKKLALLPHFFISRTD